MFFYEWVVPFLAVCIIVAAIFYLTVRNRSGAGIRTEGRTVYHKSGSEDDRPPEA
jgi:hypothetical protein